MLITQYILARRRQRNYRYTGSGNILLWGQAGVSTDFSGVQDVKFYINQYVVVGATRETGQVQTITNDTTGVYYTVTTATVTGLYSENELLTIGEAQILFFEQNQQSIQQDIEMINQINNLLSNRFGVN